MSVRVSFFYLKFPTLTNTTDFSFAPVISASIHRYVSYFDIKVLMMVTETETITSTLHHNIFTYLDYIFLKLPSYIYGLMQKHCAQVSVC